MEGIFMKKPKKGNYYKTIGILGIFLILILIMHHFLGGNLSFSNNLKDVTSKTMSEVTTPFENFFLSFKNRARFTTLNKENKRLEEENQTLKMSMQKLAVMEVELKKLQTLLEIEETDASYREVFAKVSIRNPEYWIQTFVINKGSKDGIAVSNAVITKNGLIGKVIAVGKNSATIQMITDKDSDNKVSVQIKKDKKTYQGVISSYQDGVFKIEGITNYDGVKIGDKVTTTGLGNFPSNLTIGTVSKIQLDAYGISKILEVKPIEDIDNISYVAVLVKK